MAYFHILDIPTRVDHCLTSLAFPHVHRNQHWLIRYSSHSCRTHPRLLCHCRSSTLQEVPRSGCCCVHIPHDCVRDHGYHTESSPYGSIVCALHPLSTFFVFVLVDGNDWI